MKKILIVGAGKIGSLIALLFAAHEDYQVTVVDIDFSQPDNVRLKNHASINTSVLDINDDNSVTGYFEQHTFDALISCLPYFCNEKLVELAKRYQLHYFDLTEDTKTAALIKKAANDASTAFVPQCGLAPGIVGIIGHTLMQKFDEPGTVKLRAGALPVTPDNILGYALTWSIDGLINEYGNLCHAIKHGKKIKIQALEGLESLSLDGLTYECFNTSGGLGNLANTWDGRVDNLSYKTIRYPGHCEIMRILMNGLKLNQDRDTLKRILENAIPRTYKDVVIIYVSVTGKKQGALMEESYIKKIYSQDIFDNTWGAIQITTAGSLAAVVDTVLSNPREYTGFIQQERFSLAHITRNRFGTVYKNSEVSS